MQYKYGGVKGHKSSHVLWSLALHRPVYQINRAHTSHINGSTRAQLTHSHFLFPLQKVKKSLQKKNPAKLPIMHH